MAPDEPQELNGSLDKSFVIDNHQENPVFSITDPHGSRATTFTARFTDVPTGDVLSSRCGSVTKDRIGQTSRSLVYSLPVIGNLSTFMSRYMAYIPLPSTLPHTEHGVGGRPNPRAPPTGWLFPQSILNATH